MMMMMMMMMILMGDGRGVYRILVGRPEWR
jgi:hypothetical protein